jgi:hypothetical protein
MYLLKKETVDLLLCWKYNVLHTYKMTDGRFGRLIIAVPQKYGMAD